MAKQKSPAASRAHDPCCDRDRGNARAAGRRVAPEEGFVDARRRQPGEGRHRAGLRLGRQHRRADGDLALRAEDAAGDRPARHRVAAADAHRHDHRARPRRQRQLHARAARAVRRDGHGAAAAVDGIERPTVGLLNIGEEDIKGNDVVKATAELLRARASISTATSRATTSTRERPTSSSATASSAMSR